MSSEYVSPFAALPAHELPAVEDTKDDSMDSLPSSSDRGRPGAPALTDGRSEHPIVLRHDVPGHASSGVIVPQIFTHSVPPADGRARTVSPSFEHRGDSSSSADPRSYKRRFEQPLQQMLELSQQQNAQFLQKAREAESAWEHEHADKLNLKSQFDELQSRFQSVSADLESKRALLQYQHEQHTAKEREFSQAFDGKMGQFTAESHRFQEESNRFQIVVAAKDAEIQNLCGQLELLSQQQLPPPGVPEHVINNLLQERDEKFEVLKQEFCETITDRDTKALALSDRDSRILELEQSLQQLQLQSTVPSLAVSVPAPVDAVVSSVPPVVANTDEFWYRKYGLSDHREAGGIPSVGQSSPTPRTTGRELPSGVTAAGALVSSNGKSSAVSPSVIPPPPGLAYLPLPSAPVSPIADASSSGGKYKDVKVPTSLPTVFREKEFLQQLGTNLVAASPHCDKKEVQWIFEVEFKSFDELASWGDHRFAKLDNSLASGLPTLIESASRKDTVFASTIQRKYKLKQSEAMKSNDTLTGRQIVKMIMDEFQTAGHMRESEFYTRLDALQWEGDRNEDLARFNEKFSQLMSSRPNQISDAVVRDKLFSKMQRTTHGSLIMACNEFLYHQGMVEKGLAGDKFSLDFLVLQLTNIVELGEKYAKNNVKSQFLGQLSSSSSLRSNANSGVFTQTAPTSSFVDNGGIIFNQSLVDRASNALISCGPGQPDIILGNPGTFVPACPAATPSKGSGSKPAPVDVSKMDKKKALEACFVHQLHLRDPKNKEACKKGNECKLKHDNLIPPAEFKGMRRVLRQKDGRKEINICKDFANKGSCNFKDKKGWECAFLHCDQAEHKRLANAFGLSQ